MAKYIDADKVLQCLPDDLPYKASVKRVLIQAPTADVVEVCRCEKCTSYEPHGNGKAGICRNPKLKPCLRHSNDFCSYGERKQ